jgi:hypothetical protein
MSTARSWRGLKGYISWEKSVSETTGRGFNAICSSSAFFFSLFFDREVPHLLLTVHCLFFFSYFDRVVLCLLTKSAISFSFHYFDKVVLYCCTAFFSFQLFDRE